MAWIKAVEAKPVKPIPIGVTYTNNVTKQAPMATQDEAFNEIETINTKNTNSLTIKLDYDVKVYASGSSGNWSSSATNDTTFTVNVNGSNYLSVRLNVTSNNNGWETNSGTRTVTVTGLPNGNCSIEYNIYVHSMTQNGEQDDPKAESNLKFTILSAT